jgi:hypothetical protein
LLCSYPLQCEFLFEFYIASFLLLWHKFFPQWTE